MREYLRRRIKRLARRLARASKVEYYSFWHRRAIKPATVLLESFSGNGMLCNPEAMYREMLQAPDLKHLRFVWVLATREDVRAARRRGEEERTRYVKVGSYSYYRALATSKFLVNNATFPPQFSKRPGQIYINTWHGTPLKKMGYHVPGGGPLTRNVIRNFLQADYLLSGSKFMTEKVYLEGYKLQNIYRGSFIEEGFPRIDHQFGRYSAESAILGRLEGSGIRPASRKVVVYAPTWRGSFYAPTNETDRLVGLIERLESMLDPREYCVLLKVHQIVYDNARDHRQLAGKLVPNDIPTNAVLAVTDVLVTDYSSIFVDFLVSDRPVVFYTTDQGNYESSRGLYRPPSELPGPVTSNLGELSKLIMRGAQQGVAGFGPDIASRYKAWVRDFCPWEDGGAARRVVDVAIRGRRHRYRLRDAPADGREKILIYPGGLLSNGITSSFLNLVQALDHSKYDVSVFYAPPRSIEGRSNEARIPQAVRLFPRVGGMNGSKLWRPHVLRLLDGTRGRRHRINRAVLSRSFRDEWYRCFGAAEFDYIVDFSGYGALWPNILLAGQAKTHSIWLHNDLAADALRETDGVRRLEGGLRAVFDTYDRFDRLVSVSRALEEVNATKLARYAPRNKFVSAMNIIDHERVRELGFGPPRYGPNEPIVVPGNDIVGAVGKLTEAYGSRLVSQEVERRTLASSFVDSDPSVVTFVSAGRLSPEKNHRRLLKAFRLVVDEYPNARLVLIGSGPLQENLISLTESLGLTAHVTFAGHQTNPFAVMAAADCFVLASDYEGQPMVLLEARTLGLAVVTTDFDTARDALPDGECLIVGRSVEGLAAGMTKFIEDGAPSKEFEPEKHNEKALHQFLVAIGAVDQVEVPGTRLVSGGG